MKTMIRTLVLGMALTSLAAFASDYVPSDVAWLVTSMTDGNPGSWPGVGKWQIDGAEAPLDTEENSSQNYGVKDGKYFRPKIGTAEFPGKSLTIGALDYSSDGKLLFRTTTTGETTFANEGLFLYKGTVLSWNDCSETVKGKVTVRSPEADPVVVVFSDARSRLTFQCPVESASGSGLYINSLSAPGNDASQTNFVCRFLDNALSNYNGTVACSPVQYAERNNASKYFMEYATKKGILYPPFFVTFKTDSGTMPGTLKLYPNAVVAAESATTDFSVGTLSSVSLNGFGTNILSVALASDGSACSILRVTGTLDLHSPMAVQLSSDAAGNPNAATNAAAAARLPILKAPVGVTLDPAMFLRDNDTFAYLPEYELEVSTDVDGLSTLWIVRSSKPMVWLTKADANTPACFTDGSYWSDTAAPEETKDYLAALYSLRTPSTSGTEVREFPGNSLSIANGKSLIFCSPTVRIGDLRVFRGVINNMNYPNAVHDFMAGILNGTSKLDGRMRMASGGTLSLNCYNSKGLRIDSEISGGGTIEMQNLHQGSAGVVTTSPRKAYIGLFGANVNFQGKLSLKQGSGSSSSLADREAVNLAISDARNLGGMCPRWTYDALRLSNYCALHPLESLTLDEPTRGIYLPGTYTFFTVTNDVVFTCKERITYGGILVKEGAGELALGGPQPYFVSNGTTTPTANKNVLDVWEGTLRPVSAVAFQGVAVIVTNANATLAMDVPVKNDDGDIGQYGMLNTTWDAPLTVPESGLVVQLRDPKRVLAESTRSRRVPILTVNATARAALDGKLSVAIPPSSRHSVKSSGWTENEDGSYTYSVVLGVGLIISVF